MSNASPGTGKQRRDIEALDVEIEEVVSGLKKLIKRRNDMVCANKTVTRRNQTQKSSKEGVARSESVMGALNQALTSLEEDLRVFKAAQKDHSKQASAVPNDGRGNRRRRFSDGSIQIV